MKKYYKLSNLVKRFNEDIFYIKYKEYFKKQKYKISFILLFLFYHIIFFFIIKKKWKIRFIKKYWVPKMEKKLYDIFFNNSNNLKKIWFNFDKFNNYIKKYKNEFTKKNLNFYYYDHNKINYKFFFSNFLKDKKYWLFLNKKNSFYLKKYILFKNKKLYKYFSRRIYFFKKNILKRKRQTFNWLPWHVFYKFKYRKKVEYYLKKTFLSYNLYKIYVYDEIKKNKIFSKKKRYLLPYFFFKNFIYHNKHRDQFFFKNYKKYYYSKFDFSFLFKKKKKYNFFFYKKPKTFYGQFLLKKFKLRIFYNLSKKNFKKYNNLIYKKKGNILYSFIFYLESRLDILLFRAGFSNSIKESSQLILHKNILVNNKIITKRNFNIDLFDIISVKDNIFFKKKILNKLNKFIILSSPPSYLEINYKNFNIMIISKILVINNIPYPFNIKWKDLNHLLFYNY